MASFQVKTGGKGRVRVKIKINVLISSYPTWNREFQKNRKKIQKIKKHHCGFFFKPKYVGEGREREKIKNKKFVPMSSFPTRNRKFQKIAKQFKKLKTPILATFQANISWERPRKKKKRKSL